MLSRLLQALHRPIYATRQAVLTDIITRHFQSGDKVLDVGCGSGALGASLLKANVVPDVTVEGLEKYPRGGEPIRVIAYPGAEFPLLDDSYDIVILADVLHHEADPDALLRESIRVCRRLLIIKDHQLSGRSAYARVSLIDWAANAPYGVPCLYRYNTPGEWDELIRRFRLQPVERFDTMSLYPAVVNLLFGRRLQFLVVCRVDDAD